MPRRMVSLRTQFAPHPQHPAEALGSGGGVCRLNLLLSCATWKEGTWADALPRLLEPMGVTSVRARSAREAERVIRHGPVHIAVVDLGLPLEGAGAPEAEEAGQRVLDLLHRLQQPPPTVVVRSPRMTRDTQRDLSAALKWGAFAVVDRHAADLELMLEIMQRCLNKFYHNRWPQGPATA